MTELKTKLGNLRFISVHDQPGRLNIHDWSSSCHTSLSKCEASDNVLGGIVRVAYFRAAAVVLGYRWFADFRESLVAVDEPPVMMAEVADGVAGHLVDEPRVEERQRQCCLKFDASC